MTPERIAVIKAEQAAYDSLPASIRTLLQGRSVPINPIPVAIDVDHYGEKRVIIALTTGVHPEDQYMP
jgi:hypothetical protein